MSKMKPTSVRLTEAEMSALQATATAHGTTVGALLRKAAVALSQKLGAPTRTTSRAAGTADIKVSLYPVDVAALAKYAHRNECPTHAEAARAAVRATLVARGDLILDEGSFADMDSASAAPLEYIDPNHMEDSNDL